MKKASILLNVIALLMTGLMPAAAQNTLEWTGTVVAAVDGTPIPGARLSVNNSRSVMTDDNGAFALKFEGAHAASASIITVSAPGYATRKLYLTEGRSLEIRLFEEGSEHMNQQIAMPFGSTSLVESPYSVASVSPELRHQTAASPDNLLQTVAGVSAVTRSGLPGSGSTINIHGLGSLNSTSQPLVVVDGMPYENYGANSLIDGYQSNPLSAIDVKDVESITVLKDGTSLYGAKGANGVILINTIRTQDATTHINAHVHAGLNLTPMQVPTLDADQYKSYLTDLLMSSGEYTASEIQELPYINAEKPVADQYGRYSGNVDYYRYNQSTDWQSMAYQTTFDQDYYISVKGGDETALYALSMGYLLKDGTVAGTSYDRFHARFNSDINVTAKLKARTNMSFAYGTRQLQAEGEASNANLIYNSLVKAPFTAPYIYSEDGSLSPNMEDADVFGVTNVESTLQNSVMRNLNYRFLGSLGLNYSFGKHFSLDGMFGMHFNKDRERLYYPSQGYSHESLYNADVDNKMQHRVERWFNLYGDIHASYNHSFDYDSGLRANAGVRFQNVKFENDNGYAYNSASDDFQSLGYGVSDLRTANGSMVYTRWFSAYANVDYWLQNNYFVSAILTADYSSNFGQDLSPRLQLYPSLAMGWLISGEGFMADAESIDMLKMRVSSGASGNDDLGNTTGRRYYSRRNFLGNYGLILGSLPDTQLKPERTVKNTVAFDLSMFDEALTLTAEAYHNEVKNMLTLSNAPAWTGYSYYLTNAGSMENNGLDIDLGLRLVNTKSFRWNLNVTASTYKNQVTSLEGGDILTEISGATVLTREGQPLNVYYGYQTDGVYASQSEADADGYYRLDGSVKSYFGAGDVRFVNQNTDQVIDEDDRVVIGDPNPDLYGTIVSRMKFGRLGFDMQFNYSLGNDVYNYMRCQMESMSDYNNQTVTVLNRWRYEGQQTDVPRASWGDPMGNSRFSDRWIEDGSYIRLKSLSLSYDLPKLFKGSSVFVTGENLLTLTKCKTLDPEFSRSSNPLYMGIGGFTAPLPRAVFAGIKIGL